MKKRYTELDEAKRGCLTPRMRTVARAEGVAPSVILDGMAAGTIVAPANRLRTLGKPCAIGSGLRTKVNANIGTSKDSHSLALEQRKLALAVRLGADAVMDLSTGPKVVKTREKLLAKSPIAFGTVPVYEIILRGLERYGSVKRITADEMFDVLEAQGEAGVDFFTIHSGVTQRVIGELRAHPRVLGIVSRGGAFLAEWMAENRQENPFYRDFDRVCEIARKYDVTLSLGDGLRPGAIADATDHAQIAELMTLGDLQKYAVSKGVQVMIEGPGHVPLHQIEMNVALEKRLCHGAPFYVLGPLVTDIAPGYDHITSAIGGAIAARAGADFICYVTPSEHVRLPSLEDVGEGVVASRIAAHAADIAKGVPGARERDLLMSRARQRRDWREQFKLALDSEKPTRYRKASMPHSSDTCTMCSELCSIKTSERVCGVVAAGDR